MKIWVLVSQKDVKTLTMTSCLLTWYCHIYAWNHHCTSLRTRVMQRKRERNSSGWKFGSPSRLSKNQNFGKYWKLGVIFKTIFFKNEGENRKSGSYNLFRIIERAQISICFWKSFFINPNECFWWKSMGVENETSLIRRGDIYLCSHVTNLGTLSYTCVKERVKNLHGIKSYIDFKNPPKI